VTGEMKRFAYELCRLCQKIGALSASSEMSYAVSSFFLNGGSQAWIVRIAKNPVAASVTRGLKNARGKSLR